MAKYYPEPVPIFDDLALFREWLGREFHRISATFDAVESIDLATLGIPVEKPQEGMIVLADGVNWDPGQGGGYYGFFNNQWRRLDIDTALDGQLTFPATQNPSSDPNTLDDYEEGNWTPAFYYNYVAPGATYTKQVGWYVKIGSHVLAGFDVEASNKGTPGAGSLQVGDLPFTSNSAPDNYGATTMSYFAGVTGISGTPFAWTGPSDSVAHVHQPTSSGAVLVGDANTLNGLRLVGTVHYHTST